MIPKQIEVEDEGISFSHNMSINSQDEHDDSDIQYQPIPNLEDLSKDENMLEKFNQTIQKRENMVKDHIEKIIEFSNQLFQSTQNLNKYSTSGKTHARQFNAVVDSHVVVEKLIKDCDKYITTSKQNIKTEIFKLEFDKYLIEKIKKIDDIDPHSNDRKFFELVYNHNIDYLRDRGIRLDSDDSHMILLRELLNEIEKLRRNDSIGLRSGMNKLLTEFLYKDFHTKFPTSVAYFCRKFLNGLKTVKKENDRLFNLEARKKQMNIAFNDMKNKIEAATSKFNGNFIRFVESFLDAKSDSEKSVLLENNLLKFQPSFENAAGNGFDEFFQKNWNDYLKDIAGHFYYFMGIFTKSLMDFNFPFEKYRLLALLSKQQVRDAYQMIFQNILLIFIIFLNKKNRFVSTKYYNDNVIETFLKYEKEYNILQEDNFTIHTYFVQKYAELFEKSSKNEANGLRRMNTFGNDEVKQYFLQLEAVISNASGSNILFGHVKAKEVLQLVATILFNKPKESSEELQAIASLEEVFTTIHQIYCFSSETEVKSQIRDYMKLNKKNLWKLQNDEFLRYEVKLIDLKKELEANYSNLKEKYSLIVTKSDYYRLLEPTEKIYLKANGALISSSAVAHRAKQQHIQDGLQGVQGH